MKERTLVTNSLTRDRMPSAKIVSVFSFLFRLILKMGLPALGASEKSPHSFSLQTTTFPEHKNCERRYPGSNGGIRRGVVQQGQGRRVPFTGNPKHWKKSQTLDGKVWNRACFLWDTLLPTSPGLRTALVGKNPAGNKHVASGKGRSSEGKRCLGRHLV